MTITLQQALLAISISSTIATGLFWGAIYLGRLTSRIEHVEGTVHDHDDKLTQIEKQLREAAMRP